MNEMKIISEVFQSTKEEQSHDFHFQNHADILIRLVELCEGWTNYLKHHMLVTHSLFNSVELPWDKNERVIVSSLAGSITRSNHGALISEEHPIEKGISNGRCDLWAHMPSEEDGRNSFNFYLEAKKFQTRKPSEIMGRLTGRYGLQRLFTDYSKSLSNDRITKISPYSKIEKRQHSHYIIGLMAMPIIGCPDIDDVRKIFDDTFGGMHKITDSGKKRRMYRFPSAALYVGRQNDIESDKTSSMLACFTVLAKST